MKAAHVAAAAAMLLALRGAAAQQKTAIPIRQVTTLASTDSGVVTNTYVVHVRSDGSVLHNDAVKQRLLLFDSTLKHYTIVADMAGEAPNRFGNDVGGLLKYPSGDSTAFVDVEARALVIVDAHGRFGHITTLPRVQDINAFRCCGKGVPGFDSLGRLYYHGRAASVPQSYEFSGPDTTFMPPDSAPILRANLETRRLDTLIMVKEYASLQLFTRIRGGSYTGATLIDPTIELDEWAYFDDGTVAVVRGKDYHVDWVLPDGTRKSTPSMPFDWRRLTPEDKVRMVDSVQHWLDSTRALRAAAAPTKPPSLTPDGKPVPLSSPIKAEDVKDYVPALRPNSQIRIDLDGNMWVMPATSSHAKGGTLYDVINRRGQIIERVQLPEGRNLHGFAKGGIIYMSVPGDRGWPRLERARVERPAKSRADGGTTR